jgi:DinB family protein
MSAAHWRTAIEGQSLATIDMLENAIRACPPRIWDDPAIPIARQFWYLAFHTLFWLDRYLSPSPDTHVPPAPFTLGELDPAGVYPERTYSVEELLAFLEHGRARCSASLLALDDANAVVASPHRPELTMLEMHVYSLRHVQHHTAQLNLMLRQGGAEPPRWVGRGRAVR